MDEDIAAYAELSRNYLKHDPDSRLLSKIREENEELTSTLESVRRIWEELCGEEIDSCVTRHGGIDVDWLKDVLSIRIHVNTEESDEALPEDFLYVRQKCAKYLQETQAKLNEMENRNVCEEIPFDSAYKPVADEVAECRQLLNDLTEKISRIVSTEKNPPKSESSTELDEQLHAFADNAKKFETTVTAMRQFAEMQKLQDVLQPGKLFQTTSSSGIEQLAHKAEQIAHIMSEHEEENI